MRGAMRRGVVAGIAAIPFLAGGPAQASDDRIAIVDLAFDSRPYLQRLHAAGVKVIGRYYGRCWQWQGKRLSDNGSRAEADSEVNRILQDFGVLAIYQYYSNSKYKF